MDIHRARKIIIDYIDDNAISQNELAKKVGIQQSKISYVINGKCKRYTKPIRQVISFISNQEHQGANNIPSNIERQISKFLLDNPEMEKPLSNIISNLNSIANKE